MSGSERGGQAASQADVRRWSEEVARESGSIAFLPLAEAYRAQGRAEAALRLCLRGLERHPELVPAHYLLGLLYLDAGDAVRAYDEWDIALRLDPTHTPARREIGLLLAARGDGARALRHLQQAAAGAPGDAEVEAALARLQSATAPDAQPAGTTTSAAGNADPEVAFRAAAAERGLIGAVLLDQQGYVLAGEIGGGSGRAAAANRAAELAAALRGASDEADAMTAHLGLGAWRSVLLETPTATVRLSPAGADAMLAIAGSRDLPVGRLIRSAGRMAEAAARVLADSAGAG